MDNEVGETGPVNIGNPGEFTRLELAQVVRQLVNPTATLETRPATADDPSRRKPDISKAKRVLGWEPTVPLREGLPPMVEDFRSRLASGGETRVGGFGAAAGRSDRAAAARARDGGGSARSAQQHEPTQSEE